MQHSITTVAGVDTGKAFLDLAVLPGQAHLRVGNDRTGWVQAIDWLRQAGVERIGIEASGGYERGRSRHCAKPASR